MNSFPALANVFPVKSPDPDFTICMWSCMMGGNGHFPPTCNSWVPYGIPDRAVLRVWTQGAVAATPSNFSHTVRGFCCCPYNCMRQSPPGGTGLQSCDWENIFPLTAVRLPEKPLGFTFNCNSNIDAIVVDSTRCVRA